MNAMMGSRIVEVRRELYGEDRRHFADLLGVPLRSLDNMEAGINMPAEIILTFVDLTGVECHWLRTGEGPRFRLKDTTRAD